MDWINEPGWLEYESILEPIYERHGDREFYDKRGNWVCSATDGYDFKCLENVGYIYRWTLIPGEMEYVLRLPIERFICVLFDFLYIRGRLAVDEAEWKGNNVDIIASRFVD